MKGFLKFIEKLGNKLPLPFYMFMYICGILAVLSFLFGYVWPVTFDIKSATGAINQVKIANLLSVKGVKWFFENVITNFLSVASIGTIVLTVTAVYVSEETGLMSHMIKKMTARVPGSFITPIVVFIGVMSSMASDAGYIVLVPIGALIFYAYGKHPLAGIAAAFAGVSGGFSANLIIGPIDALIASIVADIPMGGAVITATTHWFFLIAMTVVVTLVGWAITVWAVEPYVRDIKFAKPEGADAVREITAQEKRGAKFAIITFLILALLVVFFSLDPVWKLINENGWIVSSSTVKSVSTKDGQDIITTITTNMKVYAPLGRQWVETIKNGVNVNNGFVATQNMGILNSIVIIISLFFLIPGIAYGYGCGRFTRKEQIPASLAAGFKTTVPILVIIFWIGQFIKIFSWTNLDRWFAASIAKGLEAMNITNAVLLLIMFIIVVAFINILISGLSTKLYIVGPVFIPALVALGVPAEYVVAGYRVADSATNIIAPLMSFMPIIVVFCQNWLKEEDKENFGTGSLLAMMFPYSIAFLISSIALILVFYFTGLPLGF